MPNYLDRLFGHRFLTVIAIISVLLFVMPFLIYLIERGTGALPSREEWYDSERSVHGPWRWEPEAFLLWCPFLPLALVTFVSGMILAYDRKSMRILLATIGLNLGQCSLLWIQLYLLSWTTD
jgi:hypothetical protein